MLLSGTYPDAASSSVAITGLSYPAIQAACAPWYHPVQISPPGFMCLRVACRQHAQPTCREQVRRSLAAPARDFHPFLAARVPPVSGTYVHPPLARFRVAQSHRYRCGLGRRKHFSLQRPLQPYERNYPHTATAYVRPAPVRSRPGHISEYDRDALASETVVSGAGEAPSCW